LSKRISRIAFFFFTRKYYALQFVGVARHDILLAGVGPVHVGAGGEGGSVVEDEKKIKMATLPSLETGVC